MGAATPPNQYEGLESTSKQNNAMTPGNHSFFLRGTKHKPFTRKKAGNNLNNFPANLLAVNTIDWQV